jgi:hypothetical protein
MNPSGCALEVAEIDPIKALTSGALNPSLDVRWRNAKAASDRANGFTVTDGGHHVASALFAIIFLLKFSTSRISFLTS